MNPTLSPKQQEIRDREEAILALAGPMLIAEGYQGLSMDRIASELRYAKGTIYNHFPNKEEIILSLAVKAVQTRQGLFHRAMKFDGPSRSRIQAIGAAFEIYVRLHSSDFKVEQIIRNEMIWGKTTQDRRDRLLDWERQCMDLVVEVVRDAFELGDLQVENPKQDPRESMAEMLFGLWALTYGSFVLYQTSPSLAQLGITNVFRTIRVNEHRILNGIPWHPIRPLEADLAEFDRVATAIFPEEVAHLAQE